MTVTLDTANLLQPELIYNREPKNRAELKNRTHQVLQNLSGLEQQEDGSDAAEGLFIGTCCPTQEEAELPQQAWFSHFPTKMQIHP